MPKPLPADLPDSIRKSIEAIDRAAAGVDEDPFVILESCFPDKYAYESGFQIDCESRVELCGSACCRLSFSLSQQDLAEGIVAADPGHPGRIAQDESRMCVHMEKQRSRCTIYPSRPLPCRAFDCRSDPRIWLDFERREINPAVKEPHWPFAANR